MLKFLRFFLFVLIPHFGWAEAPASALPNVALVVTGGTIVEVTDSKTGASVPATTPEDIFKAVPALKKIANISVVNFSNIDSSQMTPEIWAKLSGVVNNLLKKPEIRGAIIVHGTDTMAEGAFFLDLTITENKPVVFVGAMKNASDPSSDGPPNLIDAVSQVCSDDARDWGVTLTMNNYIHSAQRVKKVQSTNVQSFSSGDKGVFGYIIEQKVYRINDRINKLVLPIPKKLSRVDVIADFAGSDGSLVRYAVDAGVEGLVVEAVGAGNVNAAMFDAILYALTQKVAVVITTQVSGGGVFPMYGDWGGGALLKKAGAIVSGDLPSGKARLLLMLALPLVGSDHQKLYNYFKIN